MDVRNCRGCGRLFNYLSGPDICPVCRDEIEKKYNNVKDYIRDNPGKNINEIAEDNGVTTSQIKQWIREERLQFSEDSSVGIECELCGANIRTGRYCEACKQKIAGKFEESIMKKVDPTPTDTRRKSESNKMRFI
ncbi:MAG: flagellar protein [Pseudobutyrivibrio sp.]|nr:flagellar protein [Pseudobutyrivibrio sp.]